MKEVQSREDLKVGLWLTTKDGVGFTKKMKILFVGKGKVFCVSEDGKYEDTFNFSAFFECKKELRGNAYISEV